MPNYFSTFFTSPAVAPPADKKFPQCPIDMARSVSRDSIDSTKSTDSVFAYDRFLRLPAFSYDKNIRSKQQSKDLENPTRVAAPAIKVGGIRRKCYVKSRPSLLRHNRKTSPSFASSDEESQDEEEKEEVVEEKMKGRKNSHLDLKPQKTKSFLKNERTRNHQTRKNLNQPMGKSK